MRRRDPNVLDGKIVDVKKTKRLAEVSIDIGGPVVKASITNKTFDQLGLKTGMKVSATFNSSDVVVGLVR